MFLLQLFYQIIFELKIFELILHYDPRLIILFITLMIWKINFLSNIKKLIIVCKDSLMLHLFLLFLLLHAKFMVKHQLVKVIRYFIHQN